ncbi:MAG: hypothetical protein ACE5KL_00160 [Alphaproteobacteria bacterium]
MQKSGPGELAVAGREDYLTGVRPPLFFTTALYHGGNPLARLEISFFFNHVC